MRQPSRPLHPFTSQGDTLTLMRDLHTIYGDNLEGLTPIAKSHLLTVSTLSLQVGWVAALEDFYVGYEVPDAALAIAQNLDDKGLLTLIVLLACALRCGNTLTIPQPQPQNGLLDRLRRILHRKQADSPQR